MRLLILSLCLSATLATATAGTSPSPAEQRLLFLLNLEREHNNVPPLAWDTHNAAAAQAHAANVLQHSELSHQYPDEPELTVRLGTAGARFDGAAENLALDDNLEDAHAALMYSPGHRANILNGRYNAVGISVAEKGRKLYVVQVFSHRLPEYSDEQFQQVFVTAVNQARQGRGLRLLAEHQDQFMHGTACSTDGIARRLPVPEGQNTSVAAFTSSDPTYVPEGIRKYVDASYVHWISVGACFRPNARYGYGNFWVVVSFGS
jgi:hypothetical protein